MNRTRLAAIAVLALLVGGTGLAGPAAGARPDHQPRPISIKLDLTFTVGGDQPCRGDAGFVPTVLDGGGQVSHLGRVDLAGGGCANFTPGPDLGALEDGFVSYTAANGDVLELDFIGSLDVDLVTGTFTGAGELVITGGTGRFSSAVGEIDWSIPDGVLSLQGGQASIGGHGWIDYDASDRRGTSD